MSNISGCYTQVLNLIKIAKVCQASRYNIYISDILSGVSDSSNQRW